MARRSAGIVVAGRGDWRRDLALAVRQAGLAVFMRQAHIGLFGGAASWLAASSPDPGTVRRTWGPEVVTIPLSEVAERYRTRAADLCRTQITLRVGEAAARELLERPLGNHHVLTTENHARAFLDYCAMSQPRAGGERPLPRNA